MGPYSNNLYKFSNGVFAKKTSNGEFEIVKKPRKKLKFTTKTNFRKISIIKAMELLRKYYQFNS